MKRPIVLAATLAVALAGAADASAAEWQAYPLPAPPGGRFSTPAGYVGDLSFWSPDRGVMVVSGNSSVPRGVYSWDGESWHQLATVCGGGINSRVAWAGPREFWTITTPSVGQQTGGQGLCHFKDGAVVGSYSYFNLPEFAVGLPVNAAACRAADDCLFGGVGGASADGARSGAFHLRWDGTDLAPVWGPQGRGVSDLIAHRGSLLESVYVGPGAGAQGARPLLRQAEPVPALLHGVIGTSFANDPFVPAPDPAVPADGGTELRAMDTDGTTAWAVGGGANSGPAAVNGRLPRGPIAVRRTDGGWTELPVHGDVPAGSAFGAVAAVPGTDRAWAAITPYEVSDPLGNDTGAQAAPEIASIAGDGTVAVQRLHPEEGDAARGAITAVACPTADDCWAATAKGYLYRRTTGARYARDTDAAFQGTISVRPNEAASQVIPDDPPADDSRLFAPPVELPVAQDDAGDASCPAPPALVSRVKATPARLTRAQRRQANPRVALTVSFRLARRARVGLRARRGGRTVAVAKPRALKPGKRALRITVTRRTWPKSLKFTLKELTPPVCDASNSDVVGTGDAR
ncbi:hypothetical protein [Patulibacter sp. SYSU D01012]|uniref:hypothetical protein n=1 Tax=Patulibacter sp. SYSU D01012 TaxID=2817381 RepID=UPI001B30C5A7|nr:hypothetical protein [Patulibacter sp. SYSU D01012]